MANEEDGQMGAVEVHITATESDKVERWRAEALERAGYEPTAAAMIAMRTDVDLHLAIELIEHGCPPDIALKILL
jgi:Tfp pilus assembly PilM family ATPase